MPNTNYYIAAQIELWLVKAYELHNDLNKILNINPTLFNVEKSLAVMKYINEINTFKIKIIRSCNYAYLHPEIGPEGMPQTIKAIDKALQCIDNQFDDAQTSARNILSTYIHEKNNNPSLLTTKSTPVAQSFFRQLSLRDSEEVKNRYKARGHWKLLISKQIIKNRAKKDAWTKAYFNLQSFYQRVDVKVKILVRETAREQHAILMKQHQALISQLDIFEQALALAQENSEKLFENMDLHANIKAQFMTEFFIGTLDLALSPFLLDHFLNTSITLINCLAQHRELSAGAPDSSENEPGLVSRLAGYLPDPKKKTYVNAYQALSNETLYERLHHIKKYLHHKISPVSETASLLEVMSDDSKIWGQFNASDIIHAHRIKVINDAQYKGDERLPDPEKEDALVAAMAKPLKMSIKYLFETLRGQYGSRETAESIQELLKTISFDENQTGPQAHNRFRESALVKSLAMHIEIYFIVKYLVENTEYFGGASIAARSHRGHHVIHKSDERLAEHLSDSTSKCLVRALLSKIIDSDNETLKNQLGLISDQPKNTLLNAHPLLLTAFQHRTKSCLLFSRGHSSKPSRELRLIMISAIIETYYNQDLNKLLKNDLLQFARTQHINVSIQHHDSQAHWLSDKETQDLVQATLSPFINQAKKNVIMQDKVSSISLELLEDTKLVSTASVLCANRQKLRT